MFQERRISAYQLYLLVVAVAGLFLLARGVFSLTTLTMELRFLLMLGCVIVSAFITISTPIQNTGITYATSAAISLTAAAIWDVEIAIVLMSIDTFCIWLFKPTNAQTWKKHWPQLFFNLGMLNLAMWAAGSILLLLRDNFPLLQLWPWQFLAWLVAGAVYAELNLWILLGIVRLQNGQDVKLWEMWRAERWATHLDIAVLSCGGAALAFASEQFGLIGTLIFFLPIMLSAYAFHLYVRNMQNHMANLEEIVASRTEELAQHAELLQKLNQEKDSFLTVLTHDMVTPLTSMQIATELIKKNPHLALENPDLLPLIQRNQQMLFQITQNILDISKLQANCTITVTEEIYDLGEQIEEVTAAMQLYAQTKAITIHAIIEKSPLLVYGDPSQLERVIFNLLSNAIKYSYKKSTVTISAYAEDETVHMTVQDQGYGIASEELTQIFDQFHRVGEHKGKAVGTGLGLAIVKALVEAHGGDVSVTSEVGVGSTFHITLPTPRFE